MRQLVVTVTCKKIEIAYRFQGKGNMLVKFLRETKPMGCVYKQKEIYKELAHATMGGWKVQKLQCVPEGLRPRRADVPVPVQRLAGDPGEMMVKMKSEGTHSPREIPLAWGGQSFN